MYFIMENEVATKNKKYRLKLDLTEMDYHELYDKEEYNDFIKAQELKYGVFDGIGYGSGENCENGYTSYEIESKYFPKIMNEFKTWFKDHNINVIGKIEIVNGK